MEDILGIAAGIVAFFIIRLSSKYAAMELNGMYFDTPLFWKNPWVKFGSVVVSIGLCAVFASTFTEWFSFSFFALTIGFWIFCSAVGHMAATPIIRSHKQKLADTVMSDPELKKFLE